MILRLQTFLAGLLALLVAALLALGPASANPASGGYQLFEPVALEHQQHIQLSSLGNFDYHAKIASECCNATNRGALPEGYRVLDDSIGAQRVDPPDGYRWVTDSGGTPQLQSLSSGRVYDSLDDLPVGSRPPNLTPAGAGRSGAFNQAKRDAGIPTSQQPSEILPNYDRQGNLQPGYQYVFETPAPGGGTQRVVIRDDAGGHIYIDDPTQNRGPHFNTPDGGHYDY